jgi:dipeptidyl aminopeptidase/acylaminoacyl peptidase
MPSFKSGGKPITLDHYSPAQPGFHPAIIMIHGSGGPLRGADPIAEQATKLGIHVFVVHYFERTGHGWVSPTQVEPHFLEWLQTLKDAVDYVATQPGVDTDRIGLLGFSLGGYLAISLAAQDNRIAAVIEVAGGLPKYGIPAVKRLPPTLILHGDADTTVPVSEAHDLETVLKRLGTPYEKQILNGQGHVFRGMAQFQALTAIAGFLSRQFQLSPVFG